MEIIFKDLSLDDKPFIDSILEKSDKRFCEFTFGNMFCWGARYNMKYAKTEKGFVIGNPVKGRFNFPAGQDAFEIVKALLKLYPQITFTSLSESEALMLEEEFDCFEISKQSKGFDYIYLSEKLSTLSGKKLAAKRNHINAFLSEGSWYTEPITPKNVNKLFEFNSKWCSGLCSDKDSSLYAEMCAVKTGLENFEKLGYTGLILYKDDKICGYSYGEPINSDTFCVHVEKADADIRGAYQMINREFVRTFCEKYKYVNREDDAEDEGLRRAKLSYYPTDVGTKWKAEVRK